MKPILLISLAVAAALAQRPPRGERTPEPAAAPAPAAAERKTPPPEEKTSRTQHTVRIGGQEIKYTATAGTINLKKEDGTVTASIFYTAYTRDGVTDPSTRPLTYAFNGGPGSSSVWLHVGALGPRRVAMNPDGTPTAPPYRLVDNEYSILDVTDVVFIDPVSTGFSRAATPQEAGSFHGITGDLQSVAEFIRLYMTRNTRWTSPKFLAGESYGTTRASALSGYLQQNLGMNLNGIMLISSVLNFQTLSFDPGNDLPYILFLPTYTATAWYHKKLPKELMASRDKALAEAERFASGEYAAALMKGAALSPQEYGAIAQRLARLTGLSVRYIEQSNLRVPIFRFVKELLRDQRRTVGRYDSRITGIDQDLTGANFEYDPSYATVQGPFTATWNQYVRSELKFESDLPYEILTGRVRPWSYNEYQNRYVNVAETLRSAMTQNPYLRVHVANGYYDLATPFHAARYTFEHMALDPAVRGHYSMSYYDAGHMMYTDFAQLQKLKKELAAFMASAVPK
ncbi:MAG: S10 family peptidase [Bryobacteraceae bacterium]